MRARTLIMIADKTARDQGLNQREWSTKAGHAKSGQTVSRIISKGDCRLSTFIALIQALGLDLQITNANDREGT